MLKRRDAQASHTDPVTGDRLTTGEYVSWMVQGIIRRWTFLIIVTLLTVVVWVLGTTGAREWWNYAASYLAIFIESVVGIAMFNQTKRDAVIIREIRTLAERIEDIAEVVLEDVEDIEDHLAPTSSAVHYSESEQAHEEVQHGTAGHRLPTGEHSEAE